LSENNNKGISTVVPVEDNRDEKKGNKICSKDGNRNEGSSSEVHENRAQRLKLHQSDEGAVSDSARSNRRLVQVARQVSIIFCIIGSLASVNVTIGLQKLFFWGIHLACHTEYTVLFQLKGWKERGGWNGFYDCLGILKGGPFFPLP
jgi:hypothetical protein